MRKMIALLVLAAIVLVPVAAMASVNMELFDTAKKALSYISYGEYTKALKAAGLNSDKESAKKLKAAVGEGLSTALYGEVQTEVAMCYRVDERGYALCVPVEDPLVGGVEALVMLSRDGESFGGYRTAMWSDCTKAAKTSDEVIWCDAIRESEPLIVAD